MSKLVSILQDQERPPALLGRDHAVLPDVWCGYHEMEKPPPAISVGEELFRPLIRSDRLRRQAIRRGEISCSLDCRRDGAGVMV